MLTSLVRFGHEPLAQFPTNTPLARRSLGHLWPPSRIRHLPNRLHDPLRMNWRSLEAILIDIVRKQGHLITEDLLGNQTVTFEFEDGFVETVNLTDIAQQLPQYLGMKP